MAREPQFAAERRSLRLFREEAVGAAFDNEAVELLSADHSAPARASFQEVLFNRRPRLPRAGKRVSRRQAGDAAAYDHNASPRWAGTRQATSPQRCAGPASCAHWTFAASRVVTMSASAIMNKGLSLSDSVRWTFTPFPSP